MDAKSENNKSARRIGLGAIVALSVVASVLAGAGFLTKSEAGTSQTASDRRGTEVSEPSSSSDDQADTSEHQVLHRPGEAVQPGAGTGSWENFDELLTFVIEDAHSMWTGVMRSWGHRDPAVNYRWIHAGETVTTPRCESGLGERVAIYCPNDDTIYISTDFMAELWEGRYRGQEGTQLASQDMSAAIVVAHEYGHNMQYEYGINTQGGPATEQHADCLAGVWLRRAHDRNLLDDWDGHEAVNLMRTLGDNLNDHGSGDERHRALYTGFVYGTWAGCNSYIA